MTSHAIAIGHGQRAPLRGVPLLTISLGQNGGGGGGGRRRREFARQARRKRVSRVRRHILAHSGAFALRARFPACFLRADQ